MTYIDYRHEWLGMNIAMKTVSKLAIACKMELILALKENGEVEMVVLVKTSSKGNEVEVGYKYKATKDFVLTPSLL